MISKLKKLKTISDHKKSMKKYCLHFSGNKKSKGARQPYCY